MLLCWQEAAGSWQTAFKSNTPSGPGHQAVRLSFPAQRSPFSCQPVAPLLLDFAAGCCCCNNLPQCVDLKPDWAKGYSRLGAAYYGLQEWDNAIKAYEDGE